MTQELVADLVLEGGGVKGIGLVGALTVLEERGYRFNRVAGSSAGAIVGALIAADYRTDELHQIMTGLHYPDFRDGDAIDHLGMLGKAWSLLFDQGIYEGKFLQRWLGELLAAKGRATFEQMRWFDEDSSLPAEQQYRLVVMASDISQGYLRRLPWDYHLYEGATDEKQVVDAVRASMSIPFFYEPVKVHNTAGEDCWLVDGGMLSNFPIEVFDCPASVTPRWPTFGIKLSAHPDNAQKVAHRVHDTASMISAMVATLTGAHDQIHLDDPAVLARTIFVDTTGVAGTDFDITPATQQQLYQAGRDAALKFLDGDTTQPPWNWDQYVTKYR